MDEGYPDYISEILTQLTIISRTSREMMANYTHIYEQIRDLPVSLDKLDIARMQNADGGMFLGFYIPVGLMKYIGNDGEKFAAIITYASLIGTMGDDEQSVTDSILDAMNYVMADPDFKEEKERNNLKNYFGFFLSQFSKGKALVDDYNSLID